MKHLDWKMLLANGSCNKDAFYFRDKYPEGGIATLDHFNTEALNFDWLSGAKVVLTAKQQQVFEIRKRLALRIANGRSDPQQILRRQALARAFYEAYSSPEE
jgi:hypothetical protein